MRVYHFVNLEYGLEDLRRRRLKIATLNELNDPFELFGVNLSDTALRQAFRRMKDQIAINRGLLCFSKHWRNPVQWSHYAGKHSGLCLGFDMPDIYLKEVNYSGRRLAVSVERFLDPTKIDEASAANFLFTKFSHWRYENEVRCFLTLEDPDPDSGLFFADFSERLILKQVIVGAQCGLTRAALVEVLDDLAPDVVVFKARLAFASFRVVRQKNESLWN
jgi:hypothetical protein